MKKNNYLFCPPLLCQCTATKAPSPSPAFSKYPSSYLTTSPAPLRLRRALTEVRVHTTRTSTLASALRADIIEERIRQLLLAFELGLLLLQLTLTFRFLRHLFDETDGGKGTSILAILLSTGGVEGGVPAQDVVFADCEAIIR